MIKKELVVLTGIVTACVALFFIYYSFLAWELRDEFGKGDEHIIIVGRMDLHFFDIDPPGTMKMEYRKNGEFIREKVFHFSEYDDYCSPFLDWGPGVIYGFDDSGGPFLLEFRFRDKDQAGVSVQAR